VCVSPILKTTAAPRFYKMPPGCALQSLLFQAMTFRVTITLGNKGFSLPSLTPKALEKQ